MSAADDEGDFERHLQEELHRRLREIERLRAHNRVSWRRSKFAALILFAWAGFSLFNPATTPHGWLGVFVVICNLAIIVVTSLTWPANLVSFLIASENAIFSPVPWPLGPGVRPRLDGDK